MAETTGTDHLDITADEAVEYCVHHLRLALLFFQNTPEDQGAQLKEEFFRIMRRGYPNEGHAPIGYSSGLLWINSIVREFEDLKREQGD